MYKFGCPVIKTKLDFGDYSAQCELPSGVIFSLVDKAAVERKADLTEICGNMTTGRERFKREFERAQTKEAKLYLLIEKATWEKAYGGMYRSKMTPNALTASLTTWMSRYDTQILMCQPDTTAKLIHDVLYREMTEALRDI